MIIIEENELYQTDNFEDVLQHHGVKGMKWGTTYETLGFCLWWFDETKD